MNTPRPLVAAVLVTLVAAACDSAPAPYGPDQDLLEPALAKTGGINGAMRCPDVDVVVDNEADYIDALASSAPGTVVGIDGTIELQIGADILVEGLTLTCATPGSGLAAAPGSGAILLYAAAPNVTVTGLILDGTHAAYPIRSLTNANWNSDGLQIRDNDIICGSGACIFLTGTARAVVEGNRLTGAGQVSGIHMQGVGAILPDGIREYPINGSVVRNNGVHNTVPSPINSGFGGIRVRDGSNVEVTGNTVTGPWSNSLSPDEVFSSELSHNDLSGALAYGIRMSFNAFRVNATPDNRFQGNTVADVGVGGILVEQACGNLFIANNVRNAGVQPEVYFAETTGGNAWLGNSKYVLDEGSFDCDGDGTADPNVLTGPGMKGKGKILGQIVSGVQGGGGALAHVPN